MHTIYIMYILYLLHFEWADQRKHCANIRHMAQVKPELCQYLDTGIVWLKLPKAHLAPSNLKRSLL